MSIVKVYECDRCGKIIKSKMDVYILHFVSIGKNRAIADDSNEPNTILKHLCSNCIHRMKILK